MNQTEYLSSAKVIFSDRGSIYFGILVILFMLLVSITFFLSKLQKTPTPSNLSSKSYRKQVAFSRILRDRFQFSPSQANSLFFFFKSQSSPEPRFNLNASPKTTEAY